MTLIKDLAQEGALKTRTNDTLLVEDKQDDVSGKRNTLKLSNRSSKEELDTPAEQPEQNEEADHGAFIDLSELRSKTACELLKRAENLNLQNLAGTSKQDLIVLIAQKEVADHPNGKTIVSSGVAEVLNEGFAFMRSSAYNYLASQDDVYISPGQVRRLGIRTGDSIYGEVRAPKKGERYFALAKALEINNNPVSTSRRYIAFESLVPFYPDTPIKLECEKPKKSSDSRSSDLSGRIIDIIAPLGRGQRALIVAQPKTGKTILLQNIAHSISSNYPDIHLIILLIDERPEEVTDMRRSVNAEVVSSTFDEPADKHVYVAEFAIEKAKRLVEQGKHVVILLDSITRLARAYNSVVPSSGKLLSGGVDSNALQKAKRLFGAARNIEGGGSLTIIGTALVDTGSRMDELIYEEFKGTGNSEIILDRKLAEKRLFPAIDITKSGTRKEELLLDRSILNKVWVLRRILNQMTDADAIEFVIDKLQRTKNNEEFFLFMDKKANG
ncbi:transcription termination factor Rho [Neorickettsia helminthoeca str. Oregon]|uniref:Transcription termination factor Rho n=1 Tax=Neorickettsia helminthoeca str. Oregon TaxID=1286528 RepID=X5GVI4_9RICK|nr:transcription termination factor Rho [Neorickettsia helminthoeca]AHX11047.1 transcription termination factor Rho [Neorickettsia helminthoeca str. Oregon]